MSSLEDINTNHDIARKLKLTIPTFKGQALERPLKFLSELQNDVAIMRPDESELPCIILRALEGDARKWYYLLKDNIKSFKECIMKFKDRFWSNNIQWVTKRKIQCGQYFANGNRTRANHATYMFGLARELEMNKNQALNNSNSIYVQQSQDNKSKTRVVF